ncbi:MAG: carbohydrate kinase family protein [Alkalispirochaeta sp.]
MIVHAGEALIDFLPVHDEAGRRSFTPVPGGSPYNTAVAAARLEVPTAFLGKISNDLFGKQIIEHLRNNGVGTDLVVRSDRLSTLAFVQPTEGSDVEYAFFSNGAADRSLDAAEIPELGGEISAIQFGSISLIADPTGATILELIRRERARRVTSFDPNIRPGLIEDEEGYRARLEAAFEGSTIVKISAEDLRWIYPDRSLESAVSRLIDADVHLVVVTDGAAGSRAYTAGSEVTVPAQPVTVVDTVGAGDSFHGGVLAWLHHSGKLSHNAIGALGNEELTRMLSFAAAVGGVTCSRPGNDPPHRSDLPETIRALIL